MGASFFSLIAWSQILGLGKHCTFSLLKTWACLWYSSGSVVGLFAWNCSASLDAIVYLSSAANAARISSLGVSFRGLSSVGVIESVMGKWS